MTTTKRNGMNGNKLTYGLVFAAVCTMAGLVATYTRSEAQIGHNRQSIVKHVQIDGDRDAQADTRQRVLQREMSEMKGDIKAILREVRKP